MTTQPLKHDDNRPPVPSAVPARNEPGLPARPSLSRQLSDLAGLTFTRFTSSRPRSAVADPFDITLAKDPDSRAAASALLDQFSGLAGQTHALSDDPWQFLWAKDRRAFLPFQELAAALITWRDPVGPGEMTVDLIEQFRACAAQRGKHAVLLGVSRPVVERLPDHRFRSVWIGSEPTYDLAAWHTRGKAGMKVRLACNHAQRLGAVARETHPLQNARDRAAIERITNAWMCARPERQTKSFLRTAPFENAWQRRYFVVEIAGRMESFLVCSPVSRRGQYLQDLVRQPEAPRGVNELAILTALRTFQDEGLDFATGGIVPFFDPYRPHSHLPARKAGVLEWTVRHFDRLYHFAGLQQFRAKFVPTRAIDIYVLLWPGLLTPTLAWDLRSLLS
jgi:phosphatidylglycerol lysyltransferase